MTKLIVHLDPAEAIYLRRLVAVELRRLRITSIERSYGDVAQEVELASAIHDKLGGPPEAA